MKGVAWLNAKQAAEHLGFGSMGAFYTWLWRQPANKPKRHYLNRRLRFRQVDLDACVESPQHADEAPASLRVVGGRGR